MSSLVCRLNSFTFRLSTMPSCTVAEAMEAYQQFKQVNPENQHPNFASCMAMASWIEHYKATHPNEWWEVGVPRIVTLLSDVPLTHAVMVDIMEMCCCLAMERRVVMDFLMMDRMPRTLTAGRALRK